MYRELTMLAAAMLKHATKTKAIEKCTTATIMMAMTWLEISFTILS